jgi:hypothetical protein
MKRQRAVAPAVLREMASARRAGLEDSPDPRPKRVKVTDDDANMMTKIFAAVKISVNARQGRLKKRMAAELGALRELVKKAELLSRGKSARFLPNEPQPEGAVVARDKAPPAKRRKSSPLMEQTDARQMSPKEGEIVVVPEEDEDCMIDIRGGVSPIPLVSLKKADEESKISITPAEEQDEYVDICGGTPLVPLEVASEAFSPISRSSDSGSSSSSDSDSGDSSSDDDEESVDSPAPASAPPKENSPAQPAETVTSSWHQRQSSVGSRRPTPVSSPPPPPALPKNIDSPGQPPAPASSVVVKNTDQETKGLPISVLLARAKEAREILEQKGPGWEREKARRAVRDMEKAVVLDERIHLWDLKEVGIKQFAYVLEELFGISLRSDV